MTVTLSDPRLEQPGIDAPLDLTDGQFSVIFSAARSALGEVSVQFRHATPFSPMRQQLREVSGVLRTVLADHEVAPTVAPTLSDVLETRAEHLATQRRHCATVEFAEHLRTEEAELRAIVDVLHGSGV